MQEPTEEGTMKAALLTAINEPFVVRDIPSAEPGPGQVRIAVRASGVCGTDVHAWHGHLPLPFTYPVVCGHEPVGVVEKLGPGVTSLRIGDRVGVHWNQRGCGRCASCQRGEVAYCQQAASWVQLGGGHSELMIAEETGCALLPDQISWEDAAPIFCAGYTVMSGYRNADPRPGDRVAVLGIGGLGHLAIQYAAALGHEVIAVTGSEDKRALALEMGAHGVVVVKQHAGNELMAMGGADIVLSTGNSLKQAGEIVGGLRPEGRLVIMGVGGEPLSIDPMSLLFRQASVKGSTQNRRSDLVEALALVADGKVKPRLEVYDLADINKVMNRVADGKVRFRAVLRHQA
jgi:D-arabinose 1-dehydrogenase-like Zn-dependent alcohol dehydrogenase